MRFVPVKATEQSVLMPHRAPGLLVRQRTMLVNALRAHMAEFGIIAPQGLRHVEILTKTIAHKQEWLPELARSILQTIADQLNSTIAAPERCLALLGAWLQTLGCIRGSDCGENCWRAGQIEASRVFCRTFTTTLRRMVNRGMPQGLKRNPVTCIRRSSGTSSPPMPAPNKCLRCCTGVRSAVPI
jgi:hypothetical protein